MKALFVLREQYGNVFRLEMKVGRFPRHQNKTSDTGRCKGDFFTARVSLVDVNAKKGTFEQRCEMQVGKCLIGNILFSGYKSPALCFEIKGKQNSKGAFVSPTKFLLN